MRQWMEVQRELEPVSKGVWVCFSLRAGENGVGFGLGIWGIPLWSASVSALIA